MKKFINWFNNKKTIIGLVSLQVSEIVEEPTIKMILQIIGWAFTGVGFGHKVIKKEKK